MNSNVYVLILVSALVTALIRFAPFIIFKNNVPDIVKDLANKLPFAIMGMLVIYCIKDTTLSTLLPTVISIAFVILIHLYKKNTLLSIVLGTALYMVLIHIL